ncbi:MAG: hypothetical protein H7039_18730 [Bryobacteraceae bacterium]|nr:hypothetical protein [Bryobacteraceae bacterium]
MRVACPWFEPTIPADMADRVRPGRAPLGRLYEGLCHAGGPPATPEPEAMYESCNFGYGRDRCPRFPGEGVADAVRFSERAGQLLWVLEKDFGPIAHGVYDPADAGFLLRKQAEAWLKG